MNKLEIIEKITELSGVNKNDSRKVLDTLELLLQEELSQSQGWKCAFDKVYQFLSYLRKTKS